MEETIGDTKTELHIKLLLPQNNNGPTIGRKKAKPKAMFLLLTV